MPSSLEDKRNYLIEKIKIADESIIDTILEYDFFEEEIDSKTNKIVNGLKPFIALLYMSLNEDQLNKLFNNTI